MFNKLNKNNSKEVLLYNNILLLSRNKLFFTEFGLSDTFQNRIYLIFIHTSFLLNKIKIYDQSKKYKVFYGMSSSTAMNKYNSGVAKYRSSEGKTVRVGYKGPVENTIQDILGGIRSTCTYIGAHRIKDIPKCCTFMRVNNQVNTIYNGKEV